MKQSFEGAGGHEDCGYFSGTTKARKLRGHLCLYRTEACLCPSWALI